MEKEIIQLFSKFGIDIKNIDTEMKTSINIDATGRRKEIEDIAYELDIEIKEGKTAHLQSSVFKLSKDLIDSIHEEGIVAYTS